MQLTVRRLPVPGPDSGPCPRCNRRLPAWGGRCLCGYELPPNDDIAVTDTPPHPDSVTRIAHLSDIHVGARAPDGVPVSDRLWMILEAARRVDVDHLVVSGDLSRVGLPEELRSCEHILTSGGYPPHRRTVVPGNHDIQESRDLSHFEQAFPLDGHLPGVREVAPGVWVAAVDSNAVPRKERSLVFERLVAPVCGRVDEDSLRMVQVHLAHRPGVRLLVLHHHLARHAPENFSSRWEAAWGRRTGRVLMDPVANAAAVLGAARQVDMTLILHGHKHWYGVGGYRVGGVPVFNAGSVTLMTRPRFRIFDFEQGVWVGLHEVEVVV